MTSAEPQAPKLTDKFTFLSAWFCPFAQRVWIVLLEKGCDFTYEEVSLKDKASGQWLYLQQKPAWFTKLNPLGKVPVIAWEEDGTTLSVYESLICNEFPRGVLPVPLGVCTICHSRGDKHSSREPGMQEYAPPPEAPAMLPPNPAARASCRIVIDRFNAKFVPEFYRLLMRQEKQGQDASAAILTEELLYLEGAFDSAGPFFAGEQFSLVDAAVLPWFLRMYVLKKYRGFELPARCKKLSGWYALVTQRQSVLATLKGPEGQEFEPALLEHYKKYETNTANSTSAKDFGDR